MELKEFFRKHLMKIFLVFIALQLAIFALFQNLNHRPKAMADQLDVIEGRSAKISPLTNDEDKDEKDILKLSAISSPKHGSVKQKGNILLYNPSKDFVGKDSITYTVTDGRKESKPAAIVFRVIKNQPPVVHNDEAVVYTGGTAVIYALDNDEDKEKDSMFISETTKPLYGELNVSGNKLFYSARNSGATADSFYYTASDGRNDSKRAGFRIDIGKNTDACYPWLSSDIGDVKKPGSISCINHTLRIQASGSDIWTNSDGFYYTYQMVKGDCELSVKVESIEGPHEWTKSGLMIRENLSASSKNAFIGATTKNGITSQLRPENHEYSENGEIKSELKVPYWIKLSREGDSCRFSVSPDGKVWKNLRSKALIMPPDVYLGMAVTSHDNNGICKTVVSNYQLKGKIVVFRKP